MSRAGIFCVFASPLSTPHEQLEATMQDREREQQRADKIDDLERKHEDDKKRSEILIFMPSSGAQTDVTVYPTDKVELERWFRGFEEQRSGFASFTASSSQEIDLIDPSDVLSDEQEIRDFVALLDRQGKVLKVLRSSASGQRLLVARGAFSTLEF